VADEDCIFCKVLTGEIPAEIVDEDEHTFSLMDINPWTRGHALSIPRNHTRNIWEIGEDDLRHTMLAAQRLAVRMKERLGCEGVNLLNSCEPAAWQTIFHFHVHVIPRWADDPLELPVRPERAEPEELARVAAELRG
jgi:histidine triad (HIT) family protein